MKLSTAVRHKMQKMTALLLILAASLFLLIGVGQFIHRGITQLEAQATEIRMGVENDKVAKALMVVPKWPTQSWYPRILKKAVAPPREISSRRLTLPGTAKVHPLAPKLKLVAVFCSWEDHGTPRSLVKPSH